MIASDSGIFSLLVDTWTRGGWLMVPLLLLTLFIYYNVVSLFLQLQFHFLLQARVHRLTEHQLATRRGKHLDIARSLILRGAQTPDEVKRHFVEVRQAYLPVVNRRIRFLGVIITAGPLLGLLGTVTGMLTTFDGMLQLAGDRFGNVVTGISEALITTQTGLIISVPALVLLSFILQRRNALRLAIAKLERLNIRLALRETTPISANQWLQPKAMPPHNPNSFQG